MTDFTEHDQGITSLAYAPDGSLLISGSGYATDDIRLWDPITGRALGTLPGQRGAIYDLCFSKDGRRLISAGGDQTIGVWDVAMRRRLRTLRGRLDEVWCLALDEVRTNLFSGGKDGMLARWDLAESPRRTSCVGLPEETGKATFSGRGDSVAVLGHESASSPAGSILRLSRRT